MKQKTFFQISALVGVGVVPVTSADARETGKDASGKKPHIIFIMTDQQRWDALGCMGNNSIYTPNIDGLAKEGSLFLSAYTSAPSSTPARAGLLTGLSPWHHGMLGYGRVAEEYRYEMPRMIRELGYYTFGIGKMHWYPQKALHGFHATLVDESGRADTKDFISDYREWFQLHAPDKNPDETGVGWNAHGAAIYKLNEKLHPTNWTGETACELIRNYDSQKPLFLKISFARPHSPYDPPQRYLDMYKDVDVPKPFIGDWCSEFSELLDPATAKPDAPFANFGDDYAVNSRRHYYANITFIDDQIGEIIRLLKEKGMYDNALICFTSDHGDMMGDHYHWRKTYPYEGSAKIPLIVKWPESFNTNISCNVSIEQPVELRDFLPTFIDIAGGIVPDDMDGGSLRQLAEGKTEIWRKYIDMEHATCYRKENYWCALTDGKIKYVWNFHTGKEQLFDLVKDPKELHECSSDKKYAAKLKELRQAMVEHLSERGETFVKDGKLIKLTSTLLYSPHYPRVIK